MQMNAVLLVAIVAACTFFTRLLPFALFGRTKQPPAAVQYLGGLLPSAVIAILIVYCVKDISFAASGDFLPQLIAVALVVLLHVWKRNNLLSIGVGTACYMVMVQFVFV